MNKKLIWGLVIVLVVIGIGIAIAKNNTATPADNNMADNNTPNPTPTPTPTPNPTPTPVVKSFTIIGQNFSFSPSTISVKKGDTVRITFVNNGGTHDLRIDNATMDTVTHGTQRISGGTQETFEFIADKVGSFEYYCSVGNHRAMGMKGTLTVTE